MEDRVFIFGEAEKGPIGIPLYPASLPELFEVLGHPPTDSFGIDYAIQTLLFDRRPVYCRVREEGFSRDDYHMGMSHLEKHPLAAVCLPGVGDRQLLDRVAHFCLKTRTPILISERDLHDYLTT